MLFPLVLALSGIG